MIDLAPFNSVASLADPRSAAADSTIKDILRRWRSGEKPDTLAALLEFPDLREQKNCVVELAYEEYVLRVNAGESIDVDAFCQRFTNHRYEVFKQIEAHQFLEAHPSQLPLFLPEETPPVTDQVGHYRLIRLLGKGGIGKAYLAADPLAHRHLVLKLSDKGFTEACILAKLRTDDERQLINQFLFADQLSNGGSMIALPLEGLATLQDVLDVAYESANRGPQSSEVLLTATRRCMHPGDPVPEPLQLHPMLQGRSWTTTVVRIGQCIAQGLACLHARGIQHRDLKPTNILIRWDGRPLILDLNLADASADGKPQFGGTLGYMAPEQMQAALHLVEAQGLLDGRADLYAFGIILYELFAGKHPLSAPRVRLPRDSRARYMAAVNRLLGLQRHGAPPLLHFCPHLDPILARLVDRCLAFDPNDRPSSALAVANELERLLSRGHALRRWFRNRRVAVAAAASIGAAIIAMSAGAYKHEPADAALMRHAEQAVERKDWRAAERHYDEYLRAHPNDANAHYRRGIVRIELNDVDGAIRDFEEAKRLGMTGENSVFLAYSLARNGQHEAAIEEATAAEETGSRSAALFANRAYCRLQRAASTSPNPKQLNRVFDDARSDALAAIKLDSKCGAAWYTFAQVSLRYFDATNNVEHAFAAADAIDRAVEFCTPGRSLFEAAFRAYVSIPVRNEEQTNRLWQYLELAVRHGSDLQRLGRNPRFQQLRVPQKFQLLLSIDRSQVIESCPQFARPSP